MQNNWDNQKTKDLIKVILALKGEKEAKEFFRDLLTEKEIIEFGNRWYAAQMLNEKISYKDIEKETGLSSRTIARISKWLKDGQGGYRKMLKRVNHHHNLSPSGKRLC